MGDCVTNEHTKGQTFWGVDGNENGMSKRGNFCNLRGDTAIVLFVALGKRQ